PDDRGAAELGSAGVPRGRADHLNGRGLARRGPAEDAPQPVRAHSLTRGERAPIVGVVEGRLGQLLLLVCAAWLVAGCSPPRATWVRPAAPPKAEAARSAEPPPVAVEGGGGHATDRPVHVVQPGENLYRIALRYGVTADELADENEIADPTK